MNQLKNLCNQIPKWVLGIPSLRLKYYNQTWQKYLSRVQESRTRLVAQPVVKLIQYFGITKDPENFWEFQALSRKTHPLCRFQNVQPLLAGRCQAGTEVISEFLLEQWGIRMTFVVAPPPPKPTRLGIAKSVPIPTTTARVNTHMYPGFRKVSTKNPCTPSAKQENILNL